MRIDMKPVIHPKPQLHHLRLTSLHLKRIREQLHMNLMRNRRRPQLNLLSNHRRTGHRHAQSDQRNLHMPPEEIAFCTSASSSSLECAPIVCSTTLPLLST